MDIKTFTMRCIFIIICFLHAGYGFAQPPTSGGGSYNNGFIIARTITNEDVSVENTPYLYAGWKTAIVELTSGNEIEKSTNVMLDVVNDRIFVEMDNDKTFEISPNDVNRIKITDDSKQRDFISKEVLIVEQKKGKGKRMYELLFEHSDLVLLQKNSKSFASKASQNSYSGQGSKINDFIEKTTYYLKFKTKPYRVFKVNRKSIIGLFPRKEKWIKNYIKEQKVDFKNKEDLGKLLNQLLV